MGDGGGVEVCRSPRGGRVEKGGRAAAAQEFRGRGRGSASGILTFPLATALHLNLRLASARSRASCSSLAKVQCRFWLLLWYIVKSQSRARKSGEKDPKRHNTGRRWGGGGKLLSHYQEPAEAQGVSSAGALTLRSRGTSVRSRVSGAD